MKRVAILAITILTVGLAFNGCVSVAVKTQDRNNRATPAFMDAYNSCHRDTAAFGLIPDWGITREAKLFKCMQQAGWVQTPHFNPEAVGRYHRLEEAGPCRTFWCHEEAAK